MRRCVACLAEPPAGTMAPSLSDSDRVDNLERLTRAMLGELKAGRSPPREALLVILDKNQAGCETLADEADVQTSRIGQLVELVCQHEEISLTDNVVPSARPSLGNFIGWGHSESGYNMDVALEVIDEQPKKAMQRARTLLKDLEVLQEQLDEKLRPEWLKVHDSLYNSKAGEPMQVVGIARNMEDVLRWRHQISAVLSWAGSVCHHLRDALEVCQAKQADREKWRSLTWTLMSGADVHISARMAAVAWLRRVQAESYADRRPLDDAATENLVFTFANEVLARNLIVADDLQQRLKKCAGAVMRLVPERGAVHTAVQKLSDVKIEIDTVVHDTTELRVRLVGVRAKDVSATFTEDAEAALRELLSAIDRSKAALVGCPVDIHADSGNEEENSFRRWVRDVLLVRDL